MFAPSTPKISEVVDLNIISYPTSPFDKKISVGLIFIHFDNVETILVE